MGLPATARRILFGAFFLSGAAALVFEVVWTRLLLLEFGATSLAVATVLAAFMGGMALGSAFAPRLLRMGRDPLLVYGLLEERSLAAACYDEHPDSARPRDPPPDQARWALGSPDA